MTYVTTYCQYEKYKAGNQFKDEQGNKRVCCCLNNDICIAQRWCPEQEKYIVSERAKKICKNYKD